MTNILNVTSPDTIELYLYYANVCKIVNDRRVFFEQGDSILHT